MVHNGPTMRCALSTQPRAYCPLAVPCCGSARTSTLVHRIAGSDAHSSAPLVWLSLRSRMAPTRLPLWPSCGPAVAQLWPSCGPATLVLLSRRHHLHCCAPQTPTVRRRRGSDASIDQLISEDLGGSRRISEGLPIIQSANHRIRQPANHPSHQATNPPIIQANKSPSHQAANHPSQQATKSPIIQANKSPSRQAANQPISPSASFVPTRISQSRQARPLP